MNAPVWVAWMMVVLLAAISIMLLAGKGGFLIAGYNTASGAEKRRYDAKKLSRVVGGGFGVLAIISGISAFYKFELPAVIGWMMPWGYLGTVAAIAVLANTVCRARAAARRR